MIVGSLNHGDYEVTAPEKVREDYHNEEGYQEACKRFYPAIDDADVVIVYGKPGEHTQRDIDYAKNKGRKIIYLENIEPAEELTEEENSFDQAEHLAGGWLRS